MQTLKLNKIYDLKYTIKGYDENVSPWKYLGNNKFEDIWEGSYFDADKMSLTFILTTHCGVEDDRADLHKVESFEVLNLHDCNPEYRKEHMRSCPNCPN